MAATVLQFPLASNQPGARRADAAGLRRNRQQPTHAHRFVGALDVNQLRLTESCRAIDQSRGGLAEHHPTRRSDRFHPLRHPNLLTDCGVTQSARTDLTGDHLTRVQADPQPQIHPIAVFDLGGQSDRLLLNAQRRQTSANCMVLQRYRRAEHRHDAVTGELVHRAAEAASPRLWLDRPARP